MRQQNKTLTSYTFNSIEIQKLIKRCGIEAYALYNYLLEKLCENGNKLLIDEITQETICYNISISVDSFNKILNYMIFLGIFVVKQYEKGQFLFNPLEIRHLRGAYKSNE